MDWAHGYFTETGYSYGYYPELMPVRMRWAAMQYGHLIPEESFRYLDAGCGQGYNLILAASMHPDSEFVGIDFMPSHVAHARRIAQECGLENVSFIEGDFLELSKDPACLGEFDIAVCHGISTWVDEDVKKALFSMIGTLLRPGGIFYNSYNTYPGWLGISPFQHLVALNHRTQNGVSAINAARQTMDELKEASDRLFKTYPNLPLRLDTLDKQDAAYLTQEYNNQAWKPVYVSEMIDEMCAVKLEYLGTATLSDIFDKFLNPPTRKLIDQQPNVALREQVRDYAVVQSFRRDLYVKGRSAVWDGDLKKALLATKVILNPMMKRPDVGEPFKLQSSTGELSGNHEIYSGLLDAIEPYPAGISLGDLLIIQAEKMPALSSLIETITMLMQGGWIMPCLEKANPRGPEIVQAIAEGVCQGAPHRFLPLPKTGCALRFSETDLIVSKSLAEGVKPDRIPDQVFEQLNLLGRKLAKQGKAVDDEAEARALMKERVAEFVAQKLPFLQRVGCFHSMT